MTFEWNAPCYIRRAGWFTYAKRIRCEYKIVQRRYIQEEPGIKATAQEKSHFSRKSTHFQFKHDFGTTSARLRHSHDVHLFEPAIVYDLIFHWSAAQQRKKFTGIDQALFFPQTPPIIINATHSLVKKEETENSVPPNSYLSISQPLIAFHVVKFRKLRTNYILIFSRKIFQLKTAQSQRAFHFEANLFLN